MNIKVDARGVHAASKVLTAIEGREVLSIPDVTDVCRAVINRYDQSKKSAELSTMAQHVLDTMGSSVWLSRIEQLARSLIKDGEETPEPVEGEEDDKVWAERQRIAEDMREMCAGQKEGVEMIFKPDSTHPAVKLAYKLIEDWDDMAKQISEKK